MQAQIGLLTWTDQDSWLWGTLIVQAGYILLNADREHPHRITPSAWVIALPPYLSPRDCTCFRHLTTRMLLITSQISAGLDAARLSCYPCCVVHPQGMQSNVRHYLDLIQHLTSGSLILGYHSIQA